MSVVCAGGHVHRGGSQAELLPQVCWGEGLLSGCQVGVWGTVASWLGSVLRQILGPNDGGGGGEHYGKIKGVILCLVGFIFIFIF